MSHRSLCQQEGYWGKVYMIDRAGLAWGWRTPINRAQPSPLTGIRARNNSWSKADTLQRATLHWHSPSQKDRENWKKWYCLTGSWRCNPEGEEAVCLASRQAPSRKRQTALRGTPDQGRQTENAEPHICYTKPNQCRNNPGTSQNDSRGKLTEPLGWIDIHKLLSRALGSNVLNTGKSRKLESLWAQSGGGEAVQKSQQSLSDFINFFSQVAE